MKDVVIDPRDIEFTAIRAQGAGGQNVNKVSSAIHLRFDIDQSHLPDDLKQRLKVYRDKRISKDGIIVIKAQTFRIQEKNKDDAVARLHELICLASHKPKVRIPRRVGRLARKKRMDAKSHRSKIKSGRSKVDTAF